MAGLGVSGSHRCESAEGTMLVVQYGGDSVGNSMGGHYTMGGKWGDTGQKMKTDGANRS